MKADIHGSVPLAEHPARRITKAQQMEMATSYGVVNLHLLNTILLVANAGRNMDMKIMNMMRILILPIRVCVADI